MTKTQNIGNKTSGMSEYLIIFDSDKKCFTNQVYMKKFYALAVFTLCALAANAQEKPCVCRIPTARTPLRGLLK